MRKSNLAPANFTKVTIGNKKISLGSGEPGVCRDCGVPTFAVLISYCEKCLAIQVAKSAKDDLVHKSFQSFGRSGLPASCKKMTLYEEKVPANQKEASDRLKELTKDYASNGFQKFPYIFGPPGTGKTHLAMAALNELARQGMFVYYLHVPSVMMDFEAFKAHEDSLMNSFVLCLDDLGHHGTNQYTLSRLYSLIDHRVMNNKATVLVSNYSPPDLTDKICSDNAQIQEGMSEAFLDRIIKLCFPIEIKGSSRRKAEALADHKKRMSVK